MHAGRASQMRANGQYDVTSAASAFYGHVADRRCEAEFSGVIDCLASAIRPSAPLIVISALEEIDCFVGDAVHQTVFLSDSPGPTAAEHMF
jgi:hypothetical protein